MRFSEWQCDLDLVLRDKLDMVHLDLQHFIKPQQAQKGKGVCCFKQTLCSTTTPCMDIILLVAMVVPCILDIPMCGHVVEVIHLPQYVLL
jgi:hypothetical protein